MSSMTKSQRGDTIVEVLIAVAVISSMLVGAFTIINKSSQQIRMAQERSEAKTLATSTLEDIKRDPLAYQQTTWHCVNTTTDSLENAGAGGAVMTTEPAYQSTDDNNSSFNANCIYTITNDGAIGYTAIFRYDSVTEVYTVIIRWDKAGGGREQLIMKYRA